MASVEYLSQASVIWNEEAAVAAFCMCNGS